MINNKEERKRTELPREEGVLERGKDGSEKENSKVKSRSFNEYILPPLSPTITLTFPPFYFQY